MSHRLFTSLRCGALVLLALTSSCAFSETLQVTGHGEAPVQSKSKNKKEIDRATKEALAAAESNAYYDGIAQAVIRIYGTRDKLGPQADQILLDTAQHSASFVSDREIRGQDVTGGVAVITVVMQVDGAALRDYLDNTHGLSLVQKTEGQFGVIVLAYTVEGGDPDPNQQKKRELIYAHGEYGSAVDEAHQRTQASASDTDYADAARRRDSSASSSSGQVAAAGASNDDLFGTQQAGAVAAAGQQRQKANSSAEEATRYKNSNAQLDQSAGHYSALSAGSHTYLRITEYRDPKKGTGVTNEVRAKLGEMLKTAGLDTRFYSLELMNKQFGTEDELYTAILDKVHSDPNVPQGDYVAVALNRLTPIPGTTRRYTSEITYRVIRISDGTTLLPDKNVTGDSGDQVSDDIARSTATEISMNKAATVLPGELTKAVRFSERKAALSNSAAAAAYVIRVDNINSILASNQIKQALRSAGFSVKDQYRGAAHSETLTVDLNGHSGADVLSIVQANLGTFDVSNMDEHSATLAAH